MQMNEQSNARMNADEVIKALEMIEHFEGGYFSGKWEGGRNIPVNVLPDVYKGDRKAASGIFYLLKAGQESKWHKLLSEEYWYWHYGGTLEMTLGGAGDTPVDGEKQLIGCGLNRGESFRVYVPAGIWQTTRVYDGDFALVSCVVTPGFEREDFFEL